jgi:N-methylhydantoinase B
VLPVVFYRREFRESSGGAGKFRGGLGQVIELGGADNTPIALLCNFERVHNPARGRERGAPGANGAVSLRSGKPIRPKGRQTVPARDAICLALPGGGGFGDPRTRDPQHVLDDVLDGLITVAEARRDYAVAIDGQGRIDLIETKRLRSP